MLSNQTIRKRFADPIPGASTAGGRGEDAAWSLPYARLLGHRPLTRAAVGIALLMLTGAVGLAVFRTVYAGDVYPGVSVAGVGIGVEIGGRDREAARALLEQWAASLEGGLVTFAYADKSWSPTLGELGVRVDVDASLAAAYATGREANARDRFVTTGRLIRDGVVVPLILTVDARALDQWFSRVDRELALPPRDAVLSIDGATVSIVPDAAGVVVDRAEATRRIRAGLLGLRPIAEPLPITTVAPAVRATDLAATQEQLARALSQPATVTFEGQSWTLAAADLGAFIVQDVDETKTGAEAVTVRVDETRLAKWLSDQFAGAINRDPVDAVVGWDDRLVALEPSVDGITLRPKTFAKAVAASLFGDHAPVDVPVTVIKPEVDSNNLDALGITTKLVVGDSNYEGSNEDRATNIRVGATVLNGTLVPPGGEFSFNHAVGVITAEAGFVEAAVIQGERIGRDIGGGICQLSTTVFRAALFGGLPITEWWPHLYRLGFYEQDGWTAGLDASILQPEGDPFSGGDFMFQNPTDSWLLVESWADGARVFVVIYGPDLGYTVDVSGPTISDPIPPTDDLEIVDPELAPGTVERTELAQSGLETSYTRTVYDRNGDVVRTDTWDTRFEPKGDVWKVSPDMAGQSPAADSSGQP